MLFHADIVSAVVIVIIIAASVLIRKVLRAFVFMRAAVLYVRVSPVSCPAHLVFVSGRLT